MLVFLGCMSWICTCPALIVSRIYIYILYIYIYVCVFLTFEWIYKYGYWDLPFVEKIDGGGGYRWTILVGRQRVDSRCFFRHVDFGYFWASMARKTGRRHQHVLQHATHAKVHVRDMARLVRQVSLTAESINLWRHTIFSCSGSAVPCHGWTCKHLHLCNVAMLKILIRTDTAGAQT